MPNGFDVKDPEILRKRASLCGLFVLALVVRAAIGILADGHGEMEGLVRGYEEGALALSAGYGFVHPSEAGPREADLIHVADSLAARGQRLTPANAPRITRARWRPTNLHPPGYSLILLLLYRTLGPPMGLWARVLQAIVDSAACLLVLDIGRRLGGLRVGWFAAIGVALFPPVAYLATSRVADAWTPALFVSVFWLYLRAVDTGKPGWWGAAGIAIGALWTLRPDYALLPAFLVIGALVARAPLRAVMSGAVVLAVATFVVVLPWGIRNQRVNGRFSLGTTAAGTTLLLSIGQFPNRYGIDVADSWFIAEAQRHGFDGIDDPRADSLFKRRYFAIARQDPGLILGDVLRRLAIGLVPPYHWGYDNPLHETHSVYEYLRREGIGPLTALRRHPREVLQAHWDRILFAPLSLLLSLACLGLAARMPVRDSVLILLPWLYVILSHLFFYETTRMMVPAVFAQLIALGCLIDRRRVARAIGSDPVVAA